MDNIKTLSKKQLYERLVLLEGDYYGNENEDIRKEIWQKRKETALELMMRKGKSETAARKLLNIQK